MDAPRLTPPADLERDHWRGGGGDAPELLVFGDYECPYTRLAYRHVQRVEAVLGDAMRLVWRQLPLTDLHPHALAAAGFAEAAARQDCFWALHDVLFAHQHELDVDDLHAHAAAVGLDPRRLAADLDDRDGLWRRIQDDVESARASGAQGTPTLFVDGVLHVAGYDVDVLRAVLTTPAPGANGDSG
jgi:protein-disulfide isomerase